jgi:hypothetical protein
LAFKNYVEKTPTGFSQFLCGFNFSINDSYEVIIVGKKESIKTKELLEVINSQFIPNKVVMLIDEVNKSELVKIAPFIEGYNYSNDETTVYVCKNYVCNLPTSNKEKLMELLN